MTSSRGLALHFASIALDSPGLAPAQSLVVSTTLGSQSSSLILRSAVAAAR